MGSIFEALRAGRYPASSATAPSRTIIPTKVSGSVGVVRNRRDAIRRATANVVITPIPSDARRSPNPAKTPTSSTKKRRGEVVWSRIVKVVRSLNSSRFTVIVSGFRRALD
jgi:hypothetical protein